MTAWDKWICLLTVVYVNYGIMLCLVSRFKSNLNFYLQNPRLSHPFCWKQWKAVTYGGMFWFILCETLILAVWVSWICVYFCQVFLQASSSFSVFPKDSARCCYIIHPVVDFLKYEFWKLKLYTEFGFYSTVLWGVDFSSSLIISVWLWLSSQLDVARVWKGQQFCPYGVTWQCPETFLVGTAGWDGTLAWCHRGQGCS